MERGLFWTLFGAALVHAAWKAFWKWALPPRRRSASLWGLEQIMKSYYLDPIRAQLSRQVFWSGRSVTMKEQVEDQLAMEPLLPERIWTRFKRLWNRYHPVIMTARKRDELGSDW